MKLAPFTWSDTMASIRISPTLAKAIL